MRYTSAVLVVTLGAAAIVVAASLYAHRASVPAPPPAPSAPLARDQVPLTPPEAPATEPAKPAAPAAPMKEVTAPPRADQLLLDQWFGVYLGEAKAGWIHVLARPDTREGKHLVHLIEEHLSRSGSQISHKTHETRLDVDALLEDTDLSVVEMHVKQVERDRITTVDVARDSKGYEVATELDGRRQVRRVDGTAGVCGSWDLLLMRLAAEGKLVPGSEARFLEFELGVPSAVEKTIRTTQASPGKSYTVEFDVVHATLDARGVTSRATVGGEELRAESAEQAKKMPGRSPILRDDLSLDFSFPRFDALSEVVLLATVPGDSEGDLFADTEYQRVQFHREGKDGVYRVTMLPYRLREAAEPAAKEQPCDMKEFLAPTPMAQCDDPEIVARAKQIVEGIKDPFAQVRALAAWVHINLGKRYPSVAGVSASETLKNMEGACSEHAMLFDAFARAVGIPVRECSGYVFLGVEGGRHAWSQAQIDGKWVHVDTVVNSVGADPRYILFSKHLPGYPRDLTIGRRETFLETHLPSVHVESFVAWGRRMTPGEARTATRVKDGVWENPLLGLTVPLPEGWEAEAPGDLSTATFRRGEFSMSLRTIPYAFEALSRLLGSSDSRWKEVRIGGRGAHRRGRLKDDSVDADWAIPSGGSETIYLHFQGEGADARAAYAEAEKVLGSMVLQETEAERK